VEPVRDFIGCCFFASIGFHIFPTFIKSEIGTVLIFTILTLTLKFIISFVVIGFFSRQYSWDTFMMSTGLSQISEFTFVLGSRGRRFGVLSREVNTAGLPPSFEHNHCQSFLLPIDVEVCFSHLQKDQAWSADTIV
jgi:predicted Kef-type K+ transport protein